MKFCYELNYIEDNTFKNTEIFKSLDDLNCWLKASALYGEKIEVISIQFKLK